MGYHRQLDTNTRGAWMNNNNNIKYITWYLRRPQFFGPLPSAQMSAGASVSITVQASGVDGGGVHLLGLYDPSLPQSLIATQSAQATRGKIQQIGALLSIPDGKGNIYRSSSYISLRFWERGEFVSESQDFYITEDLPMGRPAMLRRAPVVRENQAFPLFSKAQTDDEKKRAEGRRQHEDKVHSEIRKAEDQKTEEKFKKLISQAPKK